MQLAGPAHRGTGWMWRDKVMDVCSSCSQTDSQSTVNMGGNTASCHCTWAVVWSLVMVGSAAAGIWWFSRRCPVPHCPGMEWTVCRCNGACTENDTLLALPIVQCGASLISYSTVPRHWRTASCYWERVSSCKRWLNLTTEVLVTGSSEYSSSQPQLINVQGWVLHTW